MRSLPLKSGHAMQVLLILRSEKEKPGNTLISLELSLEETVAS